MAVGDKSAQSYGWPHTLQTAVADGGEVTFPAPGFDHRYTDQRTIDVTIGGKEARAGEGKVSAEFNVAGHDDPVTLTVHNHTGVEWPAGAALYVFCPHLLSHADNEWDVKEQFYDLQQRVKALEDAVLPPKAG